MSRSGYGDYDDSDNSQINFINWRGAVNSAIRGARGQGFLKEMLAAMDGLPQKRLISGDLEKDGEVCAIGTVGRARAVDMSKIDPEDQETVAASFNIAHAMACEIMWLNDEASIKRDETPEERYERVRAWVVAHIKEPKP